MRAFHRGCPSNVGTNRVSVAHTVVCTRISAAIEMKSLPRGVLGRAARGVAGMALAALAAAALAQVPIPVDEQIRLFNSMSPAQQQSLIRELQRSLPPAQREAIIGMLQGDGNVEGATDDLDPESEAFLRDAIGGQDTSGQQPAGDAVPRLRPRDTLVIRFEPREDDPRALTRTADEQRLVTQLRDRLEEGNPYQLDGSGLLYLPGVSAIPLAGLDVDQATVRVQAETALRPFTIIVTFLPLEPVGVAALQPFGYDLFERSRRAFAPDTDIPVPADYVIGPGDTINIQLFGSNNAEYFLPSRARGRSHFPRSDPST